ncbi:MAG: (d)CMP kinase [Candidatus Eisenbacteria bacterium]
MKRLVITIDGPAGSGKSTTARLVAQRLGYAYLDTGAMYRGMTVKALEQGIDISRPEALAEMARRTEVRVETDPEGTRIIVDGRDVTDLLREPRVTRNASAVSAARGVRERMVELQRKIGLDGGIVAEGRDIGSVVFPQAEVKIYLEADLNCRAARRQRDLAQVGLSADPSKVEQEISARDRYDSTREHSPLVVPEGAVIIDNTDLTIEEQVDRVIEEVAKKLGEGGV